MPLTPEEQSAIGQQAGGFRQQARPAFTTKALILGGAMLLLLFLYRDAQDPAWRTFLVFLIVVLSVLEVVCLFGRNPLQGKSRLRPVSVEELERKRIDIEKLLSQVPVPQENGGDVPPGISSSRKRIQDLTELPPELAGRPEVEKLFQDAKALGGAVWVSTSTSRIEPGVLRSEKLAVNQLSAPVSQEEAQSLSRARIAVVLLVLCALIGLALVAFRSRIAGP
jgi:hypothetical protein